LTGLVLGLLLDAIEGAVLGQNAFSLVVVALLCFTLYQRLRVFSLLQQAGIVFVLIGVNQLVGQWVQNLEGIGSPSMIFLLPAVSSALLWPVVFHVLRRLRRNYMVT
jgi:rod shape-determining protein MreD